MFQYASNIDTIDVRRNDLHNMYRMYVRKIKEDSIVDTILTYTNSYRC